VADHWFDDLSALEEFFQRCWQSMHMTGQQPIARRCFDAAVAEIGRRYLGRVPGEDAHVLELAFDRVAAAWVAGIERMPATILSLAVTAAENLTPNA
jgi:hypothetical protein